MPHETKVCLECGAYFYRLGASDETWDKRKFCCHHCRSVYQMREKEDA